MRLIDVNTLLDLEKRFEQGQQPDTHTRVMVDFHGASIVSTKYAILSHCWGAVVDEVQFKEMKKLATMKESERNEIRMRSGYNKILDTCRQACEDQIDWVWVDTCCIHKESSAELSEAINSMYYWYATSERCYTYLHDIDDFALPTGPDEKRFWQFDGWPKWFSRGWTLQELVAPSVVHFFNRKWEFIGDKRSLASVLYKITRVPVEVLKCGLSSNRPSAAQIMSWAADRKTTREEDRAYSLLGLFGVHMPMLYGEGRNAFQRLQLEIIRMSNDHSIFAWDPKGRIRRTGSVLADDPSFFRDCHDIERMEPDEFIESLKDEIAEGELPAITDERLHSFTVTNGGIHIWLPVTSSHSRPSVFRITLACRRDDEPVTVDLAFWKSNFYRYFCPSEIIPRISEFRQLLLGYRDETRCDFTFKLDHRSISYYNFACCGIFPRGILAADNLFTLTSTDPLVTVVYANSNAGVYFAVGVGSCFGQEWVHVVCNEGAWPGWENYSEAAYDQIWNVGAEHARRMAEGRSGYSCSLYQTKHFHLPRSIWAVEVICGWGEKSKDCMVTVDVVQCSGCCRGPNKYMVGLDDVEDNDMPGLMKPLRFLNGHLLRFNKRPVHFVLAHEIELGDYGRVENGNFKREGNIFEELKLLAAELGVNPMDVAFHPVQRNVCDACDTDVESDNVTTKVWSGPALVLCRPVGLSLPNNQHIVLLLKALSTRLTARCLVTRVIQCSTWHATTPFSPQLGRDYSGVWGDSFTSGPRKCSTEPYSTTPLCTFAKPQIWSHNKADMETRSLFKEVRDKFHILLDAKWYHPEKCRVGSSDGGHQQRLRASHLGSLMTDSQDSRASHMYTAQASGGGEIREAAIKFFTHMFGVECLQNYVGNISFFEHLKLGLEAKISDRPPPVMGEAGSPSLSESRENTPRDDSAMQQCVSDVRRESEAKNAHFHDLAMMLLKRMQVDSVESTSLGLSPPERRKMVYEAGSISKSLGVGLLEDTIAAYTGAWVVLESCSRRDKMDGCNVDNSNRHGSIHSIVRDVILSQKRLDAANDEDERRALEEDITGKILLACWHAIRFEIGQVPAKAVDCILKDTTVDRKVLWTRAQRLEDIGSIFRNALAELPDDAQANLRRILEDANAGISKHELLLAERATREFEGRHTAHNSELEVNVQETTLNGVSRVQWFTRSPTSLTPPPLNAQQADTTAPSNLRMSRPSVKREELGNHDLQVQNPPRKKRTRTLTTPHQAAVLHALFAKTQYPKTAMREEVGRQIGLSARKVQIWFQNQRQRARRLQAS